MLSEKAMHRKTVPHEPTQENSESLWNREKNDSYQRLSGSRRERGVAGQETQGFR